MNEANDGSNVLVSAHNNVLLLRCALEQELRNNILPFWMTHIVDHEKGGFYGALTNDCQVLDQSERSLVMCARLLWTFSTAYRVYGDTAYLETAYHAYQYLTEKFLDPEYGGMFWWLDRHGNPVNDRKQTYGQAFAIYGLSEYYRAAGNKDALILCQKLFELIELHSGEPVYGGYIEGCSRDWGTLRDMRLSEKEPYNCPKSMNTLLHVLEGYTNLLRIWPDPRVKEAQSKLLEVFLDHVIDPQTAFTRLFFENDWTSLSNHISYGHDIETSWLIVEAAEVLGDKKLIERARAVAIKTAAAVLAKGLDIDGSVFHESAHGVITDPEKHWWCQAEGIVGFFNAYEISHDDQYFLAAQNIWQFIYDNMVDRTHGEWYKILDRLGHPKSGQVKAGPWEDPYHQSRACFEIIRRVPSEMALP